MPVIGRRAVMFCMGERCIGDGQPVFIVCEAGATHTGLSSAMELASHAARAGADAVKFQIIDPERLVPDRSQPFTYGVLTDRDTGETRDVTESLYGILKRRYLDFDQWRALKNHCDDLGIIFFSTVTFFHEADLLIRIGVDTVKICSGDITHFPLIRYCAQKGLGIQLDTGNASLGEVERAVDEILKTENSKYMINHCPTGYPARAENINLRMIPTLKQMFGCPVAFSDHTPGWEMDVAAISLGANMVEKTITLDRTTRGPEHQFSLEPREMKEFVQSVRHLETALGRSRKVCTDQDRKMAVGGRRSMVLAKNVKKGELLSQAMLDYARPGTGLSPDLVDTVMGRRCVKDFTRGHILDWGDLK